MTASRKIFLTKGKSEFHVFVEDETEIAPCICKHNVDFNIGCISNTNPYFRNAEEILSGRILELGRDTVLRRLDELTDSVLITLDSRLHPEVIPTHEFPESLKEKIWKLIQEKVEEYQVSANVKQRYNKKTERRMNSAWINKFFKSGCGLLDGQENRCKYCYAFYKNNKQNILTTEADFSELEEKIAKSQGKSSKEPIKIIRVGKSTEAASLFHLNQILELLGICEKYGVKLHIPTKHLPFDSAIAEKLRKTKSSIGYSIGYEKMEPGAVMYGFDNERRLSCAKKYSDAGVSTGLKIAWDCTDSFENCQQNGAQVYETLKFLEENPEIKKRKQLIPMRMLGKKVIDGATGNTKADFNGTGNLFTGDFVNSERFMVMEGGLFLPNIIHPDFAKYFAHPGSKHPDICGEIGEKFHCNGCYLGGRGTYDLKTQKPIIRHQKRFDIWMSRPNKNQKNLFDAQDK